MYNRHVTFYSKFSQYDKYSIPLFSDPRLCTYLQNISFSQCLGRKTLVVGESNVGKTELTSIFLKYLCNHEKTKKIYVLDMGPERFQIQSNTIGGKLSDYNSDCQRESIIDNLSYSIIPPRSSSTNQIDVYQNCMKNFQQIYKNLNEIIRLIIQNPEDSIALIINDFSIFLHLGSHIPFLKVLRTPLTVFVNSYYGNKLANDYGSNISWREKIIVRALCAHFDYSIQLIK